MRSSTPPARTFALVTALLACSIRELPAESATEGTEPDSTSTAPPGTTTTATTTDLPSPTTSTTSPPPPPGTTTTDDPGQTFIAPEDVPHNDWCDAWVLPSPDCPEGQKCTIEDDIGDTHCVDVVDAPKQLHEPCQVLMGGPMSGHDDCDEGLLCWNVDPDTGAGLCIAFCQSFEPDGCPPATACVTCQSCAVGLCLPGCNPLKQDCPNQDLCLPNPQNADSFICVLDGSGEEGQVFDPCEFANACDPGLTCTDPALANECDEMVGGCCLPFCDLAVMPPACPGVDQQCIPWYEEGAAPPGLENVGLCGIPQ